jgi:protein-tyrosine phosphatase
MARFNFNRLIDRLRSLIPSTGEDEDDQAETGPLRPHKNTYWAVAGQLLAGEYPASVQGDPTRSRERLNRYMDLGVTFFVDLTHPDDPLAPYDEMLQETAAARGLMVEYRHRPIIDRDVPETPEQMAEILDTIDAAIENGRTVYVHCWGGVGRTGTVVGCHLVRHGMSGEEALRHLNAQWQTVAKRFYHPHSPEMPAQWDYVRRWSEMDPAG